MTYNIICKKCRADRRSCSRCDDNVEFVPRQLGLTECRVSISSLWAHTPYTFDIQAVNGVSSKSPFPPQHVSVNITTNQAGKSGVFSALSAVWSFGLARCRLCAGTKLQLHPCCSSALGPPPWRGGIRRWACVTMEEMGVEFHFQE